MSEEKLLDHDADGIKEYDNDLPNWWVWLFVLTIIWSGVYVVYFHFTGRPSPREQLAIEMKEQAEKQAKNAPSSGSGQAVGARILAAVQNPEMMKIGKAVYDSKCVACHLAEGQGLVGPNLTDEYWIHGGQPEQIRSIIVNGVAAKGMIAWGPLLKAKEVDAVTAFVVSLKGTSPPNPKAPQGKKE